MSSHSTLDAASQDRKARLAQLKNLKRKQPPSSDQDLPDASQPSTADNDAPSKPVDVTSQYLSGRNYDSETKGLKLGFESAPAPGIVTLENQSIQLAEATKAEAQKEQAEEKPLDLFKLQPKKPNWDLKRDLDKKLEILNVRTDNAIAKLVRQRIQDAQSKAKLREGNADTNGDGEVVGIDGAALVEATHVREREEEEEERREREEEEDLS